MDIRKPLYAGIALGDLARRQARHLTPAGVRAVTRQAQGEYERMVDRGEQVVAVLRRRPETRRAETRRAEGT